MQSPAYLERRARAVKRLQDQRNDARQDSVNRSKAHTDKLRRRYGWEQEATMKKPVQNNLTPPDGARLSPSIARHPSEAQAVALTSQPSHGQLARDLYTGIVSSSKSPRPDRPKPGVLNMYPQVILPERSPLLDNLRFQDIRSRHAKLLSGSASSQPELGPST